jgi:hypothetical protein
MTVCIFTNYLDPTWSYPVLDPRRTAGPGPYRYGYGFYWDVVIVTVERKPGFSSCEMEVALTSTLAQTKGIQTWNLYRNTWQDLISTSGSGQPVSMVIQRAWGPGHACGTGTDTVVLNQLWGWPTGWKALYYFSPQDFWDFWGGCQVTFNWVSDTVGSGVSGSATPPPTYPLVRNPDGTIMMDPAGSMFLIVGGAAFPVAQVEANAMGLTGGTTIPLVPMPLTPADGTLVQEYGSAEVYVIYGGYPFKLPTPETLFALGFDWGRVRSIPSVGLRQLLPIPIDGTLLKEQPETVRLEGPRHDNLLHHPGADVVDPEVYLVDNQKLRHVTSTTAMEENCLPWRHVRTVPPGSLAPFEAGPDIGP